MEKGKGHGTLRGESQQLFESHANMMTVPYATACKWVHIRSPISVVTFDVENGEK